VPVKVPGGMKERNEGKPWVEGEKKKGEKKKENRFNLAAGQRQLLGLP